MVWNQEGEADIAGLSADDAVADEVLEAVVIADLDDRQLYRRKGQIAKSIAKREKSLQRKNISGQSNAVRIAFTFYVIAIAAKLAKIDAPAGREVSHEIDSFKEIFSIAETELSKVETFYREARNDEVAATHYAQQIVNLFPTNKILLEELVADVLVFADADGPMTSAKVRFLKAVFLALNFNENYFRRLLREHMIKYSNDPFELLGVERTISYVDLKKVYRDAVKDCHPDKFAGSDVASELLEIAKDQFTHFTLAYEAVKLKRGFIKKNA